jgi:hypothetical protein
MAVAADEVAAGVKEMTIKGQRQLVGNHRYRQWVAFVNHEGRASRGLHLMFAWDSQFVIQ